MSMRVGIIASRIVVAASFSEFETMLRRHDWTYAMSDDHRYWVSGEAAMKKINQMARELVKIDPQRTAALYNKYGREGWGREWKDVGPDTWIDMNKRDSEIAAYHRALESALKKFGRSLGKVVSGKWWTGDIRYPANYLLIVQDSRGSEIQIGMMGTMKGTLVTMYKDKGLVAQQSIPKYYNVPDGGLRTSELSRALDGMARDLVRRGVLV